MMKSLLGAIAAIRELTDASLGGLLDFIDQRNVIRRGMLLATFWMMVDAYMFAKHYLETHSGVEASAAVAAITIPITMLLGFQGKVYSDSRDAQSKAQT